MAVKSQTEALFVTLCTILYYKMGHLSKDSHFHPLVYVLTERHSSCPQHFIPLHSLESLQTDFIHILGHLNNCWMPVKMEHSQNESLKLN